MIDLNYLLLTEVKGREITSIESFANYCLQPAHYLWNGKKVDLIQEDDLKAVQIDVQFQSDERSWVKAAIAIIFIAPGTLIGVSFKLYAFSFYHKKEVDDFIIQCLKTKKLKKINTPINQKIFGTKILRYIVTMRSALNFNEEKTLFLSEIVSLSLLNENIHPIDGKWLENINYRNKHQNEMVIQNIHFIYNLKKIYLADKVLNYEQRKKIIKIDPFVSSFHLINKTATKWQKATCFLS